MILRSLRSNILFLAVFGIVAITMWRRLHVERERQQTIRLAIERGQTLDAALVEKMLAPPVTKPSNPFTWPTAILSAGLGLGVFSLFMRQIEEDAFWPLMGSGSMIAIIGAGLFLKPTCTRSSPPATATTGEPGCAPPGAHGRGRGRARGAGGRWRSGSLRGTVRRREPRLRQFLRRVCADAALADDLAQQSFLQAWMQLGTLREPAAFGSWLRQLALNTALQQMRRRSELLDPDAGIDVAVDDADPGLALDLERSLARLRPDERICVVLCHAEGMSHAEISKHTGWPLGTVKSHVTRGSARLAPGWIRACRRHHDRYPDILLQGLFANDPLPRPIVHWWLWS